MAERTLNPMWVHLNRILKDIDIIDRPINETCELFYREKEEKQFVEVTKVLAPQIKDYRVNTYTPLIYFSKDIDDDQQEIYLGEIKEVVTHIDKEDGLSAELAKNAMYTDFYDRTMNMRTTLKLCLPE
jgi:hypothetical protein